MPGPTPLPPQLFDGPFRVSDAVALGVPVHVLDGRRFTRPTRGVRLGSGTADLVERCRAIALVLSEHAAWSHLTSIRLADLPLPAAAEPAPLEVSVPSSQCPPRRRGLLGHRGLDERSVVTTSGLRVVHPASAWATLGTRLAVEDLVVLGDALVTRGLTTPESLRRRASLRSRRGVTRLREAAALVRIGADSRPETLLRLLILRAGLPEPTLQHDVVDADGTWVARPDLSYPELRIAIEYDGAHHLVRSQWRHDLLRTRGLHDRGWRVLVVTAEDLFGDPGAVVAWVRAAVAAAR